MSVPSAQAGRVHVVQALWSILIQGPSPQACLQLGMQNANACLFAHTRSSCCLLVGESWNMATPHQVKSCFVGCAASLFALAPEHVPYARATGECQSNVYCTVQ